MIRQQMEEDFLLHSERISAQKQSVARVERALDVMGEEFDRLRDAMGNLKREFQDFAHTTRSYDDSWASERKRNLRMMDVIQTGLLTGNLETDSRLGKIEWRLSRLEENSGAA